MMKDEGMMMDDTSSAADIHSPAGGLVLDVLRLHVFIQSSEIPTIKYNV